MRKGLLRGSVAAFALAALMLSGCTAQPDNGTSGNGGVPAPTGTLELGTITAPSTLEANNAYWANESPYLQAVYDGLLHSKPDGTYEANLATEWKYSDDQKTLTMKLRDDVSFTDGEKFTAQVAADNLKRFRDGTSPSANLAKSIADVVAKDATTIEIQLSDPNPALLLLLSQNGGLMQSPKTFDDPDAAIKPVGTGPYTLNVAETLIGSKYVFDYNPKYWNPKNVHYARIVMTFYENEAMVNAAKGGTINAANTSTDRFIAQFKEAGYDTVTGSSVFTGILLWDRAGKVNPALADVRVRQAIVYAIDADAMFQVMAKGVGERTGQVFPKTSPGYDPALNDYYKFNPTKAKQLLAEAGYANGFELEMQSGLFDQAVHALYSKQLADVGIRVKLTNPGPSATTIADMMKGRFAASVFRQQQDLIDWQLSNFFLMPNAPWNPFKYEDKKVVELTKTLQIGTEAQRAAAAKELNKYIVEQAWFGPWFRPLDNFVVDKNTTAVYQPGQTHPNLWTIQPKK